jgi:hypothetical protein
MMICGLAFHSRQATAYVVAHNAIFEAIDAHKAARAASASVLDVHTMLDEELLRERRCSDVPAKSDRQPHPRRLGDALYHRNSKITPFTMSKNKTRKVRKTAGPAGIAWSTTSQ